MTGALGSPLPLASAQRRQWPHEGAGWLAAMVSERLVSAQGCSLDFALKLFMLDMVLASALEKGQEGVGQTITVP